MKSSEIEVGKEYLVFPWLQTPIDARFMSNTGRRGTVTEILPGGKIRVDVGGTEAIHRSAEVYMPWLEALPKINEHRAMMRRLREEREATVVRYNEAIAELERLVPNEALPGWATREVRMHDDNSGVWGGKGDMNVTQLLAIVKAAREGAIVEEI